MNIWVRDLQEKDKERQITEDRKRGCRQFMWQLNLDAILYIQDKDGDENWHLYQTNLQTQATKNLTPFDGVKVGIVEVSSRFPNEILIQMNKRDPSLFDVYRLNLETGQLQLDTENPGGVVIGSLIITFKFVLLRL